MKFDRSQTDMLEKAREKAKAVEAIPGMADKQLVGVEDPRHAANAAAADKLAGKSNSQPGNVDLGAAAAAVKEAEAGNRGSTGPRNHERPHEAYGPATKAVVSGYLERRRFKKPESSKPDEKGGEAK